MTRSVVKRQTPEEKELERKRAELAVQETQLAQRELDQSTLQAELRTFERRYLSIVGVRYAELDEIEAQIAEELARQRPTDENARARARQARQQSRESEESTASSKSGVSKFQASDEMKKLFRDAATRFASFHA